MCRLARHLFTLFATVSLVLCVAVCVLWVRSYWVSDSKRFAYPSDGEYVDCDVRSAYGALGVAVVDGMPSPFPGHWDASTNTTDVGWQRRFTNTLWHRHALGFWQLKGSYGLTPDGNIITWYPWSGIVVPYWAFAAALLILPLPEILRWIRRRRRVGSGLCPTCGYDLRVSPERCPECGAPAQVAKKIDI